MIYQNIARLGLKLTLNIHSHEKNSYTVKADDLEELLREAPRLYSWGHQENWQKSKYLSNVDKPVSGILISVSPVNNAVTEDEIRGALKINSCVMTGTYKDIFNRLLEYGYTAKSGGEG